MGNFYTIPVPLIKRLFVNPDAYNELLHAGGYFSAKRVSSYSNDDVLKHLVYCWYRQRDMLTPSIINDIENGMNEDVLEDDYGLFDTDGTLIGSTCFLNDDGLSDGCEPETPIDHFGLFCKENLDFMEKAIEWHDVYVFYNECKVRFTGHVIAETIRIGKPLSNLATNCPYAIISPHFLMDYRDKNKTERARAELAMLLAINSITGKQEWAATTTGFIKARMFGAKNVEGLDDALHGNSSKETQQLKAACEQYTTRRIFESMRDSLMRRGLIKCWVPQAKRVFVSPTKKLEEIETEILEFLKRKTSPKEQIKKDTERLLKLLNESE